MLETEQVIFTSSRNDYRKEIKCTIHPTINSIRVPVRVAQPCVASSRQRVEVVETNPTRLHNEGEKSSWQRNSEKEKGEED